jgi:threonine aldolase
MIDFRSDTVTRPSAAMRQAMNSAEVGDDVFGDDPTVNRLQEYAAEMLGFEAALYAPSGTQTNLISLMSHCQRGDEAIVGQMWHAYRWEAGGMAVLGSIQPQPVEHQPDGTLRLEDVASAIKPDDPHFARTRVICLENTTGGKVLPLSYLGAVSDLARSHKLMMHLDGARLFNAAAAVAASESQAGQVPDGSGHISDVVPAHPVKVSDHLGPTDAQRAPPDHEAVADAARRLCAPFDTVSVCLSKGLGAPVGSLVLGSADIISRARRVRKMLGGGMRQAGVIAAAGLYALENNLQRLAEDHQNARDLAAGLQHISNSTGPLQGMLTVSEPQTNILFVDVNPDVGPGFQAYLERTGVGVTGGAYHGGLRQRWVTHLDVKAADVERALEIVAAYRL